MSGNIVLAPDKFKGSLTGEQAGRARGGGVGGQALDAGCRDIGITVGGSASTDGGAGMLMALGAEVLDRDGYPIALGGRGLADATQLDLSRLHPGLRPATVTLAAVVG